MESDTPLNFRDVGESLSALSSGQTWLRAGILLRCGKIHRRTAAELGSPRTVVSVLANPDEPLDDSSVRMIHVPTIGEEDRYNTKHRNVRAWLTNLFEALAQPGRVRKRDKTQNCVLGERGV